MSWVESTQPGSRELLLAQSSDWAFIMRTGTMNCLMRCDGRDQCGLTNFEKKLTGIDSGWLEKSQMMNNIFLPRNQLPASIDLFRSRIGRSLPIPDRLAPLVRPCSDAKPVTLRQLAEAQFTSHSIPQRGRPHSMLPKMTRLGPCSCMTIASDSLSVPLTA